MPYRFVRYRIVVVAAATTRAARVRFGLRWGGGGFAQFRPFHRPRPSGPPSAPRRRCVLDARMLSGRFDGVDDESGVRIGLSDELVALSQVQ